MGIGVKLFVFLVWIAVLYAFGIALFTRGFLLNRLEISETSDCSSYTVFPFPAKQPTSVHDKISDQSLNSEESSSKCNKHKHFNKAIILVIDALRYDFAFYNESLKASKTLPFQNKLVTIKTLLRDKPKQSMLYKFVADPPTTTLQRLKGLTTGSLPTFVDAGSNFAGTEITEDNFISQLHKSGKRVTFMGDDTWETLFKGKFVKSFPYPSFNVKDLHTVDNGVISHLMPEINRNDWNVLIAHFLGVDHCGHRFGPYHSAMAKKLTQMDEVIRGVVEDMEKDTVLFVFGDHGMTSTGDHGGDSADEVGAALFVYSPSQLVEEEEDSKKDEIRTISQVDFVPTISLLLGLPIPFSNLGSIIPELFATPPGRYSSSDSKVASDDVNFPKDIQIMMNKVAALQTNAHQINTYLKKYSKMSDEFPQTESCRLLRVFSKAESIFTNTTLNLNDLETAEELYKVYLSGVKKMCIEIWAQFDLMSMVLGLIATGAVIVFCWLILARTQSAGERSNLHSTLQTLLITSFCVYASFLTLSIVLIVFTDELKEASLSTVVFLPVIPSMLVTIATIILYFVDGQLGRILRTHVFRASKESMLCAILTIINCCLFTSNSYVVQESYVSTYFVQTIIVFWFINSGLSQSKTITKEALTKKTKIEKSRDIGHLITHPRTFLVIFVAIFLVCVRMSTYFFACREEQYPCEESTFLRPLASFTDENSEYRHYRYFISVACLAMLPASLSFWLNKQGNLNGTSASSLSITYAMPAITVCVCLHWGLNSLPEKILDNIPMWEQVLLARGAYLFVTISMLSLMFDPMCVYLVPKKDRLKMANSGDPSMADDAAAPKVVERPKGMRKRNPGRQAPEGELVGDSEDPPGFIAPIVYGLGTVFSSGFLQASATICLLLSLLLGDGVAPAILLLIVQTVMYLELYAVVRRAHLKVLEMFPGLMQLGLLQVPWYAIAGWGFMATQYFFATGHHATVPSIRFESAFVGFYGDFPKYLYFIPALLITLNTFASQILFAVALPLLVVWPYTRGRIFDKKKSEEDRKGEMNMHLNPDELRIAMFQLFLQYMVFNAIQVFGTMLSAAIHRRHLMTWKVFAPRFVFQGASFLVTSTVLILMYPIFIRIDMALSKWLQRLFDEV